MHAIGLLYGPAGCGGLARSGAAAAFDGKYKMVEQTPGSYEAMIPASTTVSDATITDSILRNQVGYVMAVIASDNGVPKWIGRSPYPSTGSANAQGAMTFRRDNGVVLTFMPLSSGYNVRVVVPRKHAPAKEFFIPVTVAGTIVRRSADGEAVGILDLSGSNPTWAPFERNSATATGLGTMTSQGVITFKSSGETTTLTPKA